MLGFYLFVKMVAWILQWILIAMVAIVMLMFMVTSAVFAVLCDPNTWRGKPKRPGIPSLRARPRNERMYYSSRR